MPIVAPPPNPASAIPAIAANSPLSAYRAIVISVTLIPARCETRCELPTAYTRRPNVVNDSVSETTTITTIQISRLVSIPSVLPVIALISAVGGGLMQPPQVSPWVTPSERPWMIPFMPSVITTAGTPSTATPSPLTSPQTTPRASATTMPTARPPSDPLATATITIAAELSTHGTDRSMPPMRMTNVWPAATSPTNEETCRTCWIPLALAKPGLRMSPITNRAIAAAKP